jgi:hypothetical protein
MCVTCDNSRCAAKYNTQRESNGRTYYEFEFTANNGSYTRHQLAVVTTANSEELA